MSVAQLEKSKLFSELVMQSPSYIPYLRKEEAHTYILEIMIHTQIQPWPDLIPSNPSGSGATVETISRASSGPADRSSY